MDKIYKISVKSLVRTHEEFNIASLQCVKCWEASLEIDFLYATPDLEYLRKKVSWMEDWVSTFTKKQLNIFKTEELINEI